VPKMKTHSGAKKRFRVTGGGKVMRQRAGLRHNFESKPTTRTRRLSVDVLVSAPDAVRAKRLLGR
jgi:large subunit ribosomal protein L35